MPDTDERLFGTDGDDILTGDTKIDLSSFGGGEIIIEDFTSSDLDATDFDFYTM